MPASRLLPLTFTCCLLYLSAAQCPNTGAGLSRYRNGYRYCLITSAQSWNEANKKCNDSSADGQLLQLESYSKWSFLRHWIDFRSVWIAAFTTDNSRWYWTNSSLPESDLMSYKRNEVNQSWINITRTTQRGRCLTMNSHQWKQTDCSNEEYYVCQSPCRNYLTGRKSVFTSPNYPSYYPSYMECEWYVDVVEGIAVLQFQNFNLEGSLPSCSYDFVKIYEHKNSTTPLAMFCGATTPDHAIRSPSRYMYITMVTDVSEQYSGFRATVQSSTNPIENTVEAPHGVVTSLAFPGNYPNNANVAWLLDVESGSINIAFTDFSIHPGAANSNCTGDSLTIRAGSRHGVVLGKFCGSSFPKNLSSATGALHLTFTSDSVNVSSGFRAVFWSTEEICFHMVKAKGGSVQSFNYPSIQSTPGHRCIWYIDSVAGVTRLNFAGENSVSYSRYSCTTVRLSIADGLNGLTSTQPYRTYCGGSTRYNITVPSPYVILEYSASTDYTYSAVQKFKMTFRSSTNCSYNLTAPNGTVTSPDYPSYYDPHSNCSWLIDVISGNATLWFYAFAFQEDNTCSKDSFTIYDGNSTSSPKIKTYCGEASPGVFVASGSKLFLTMTSDATIGSRGFAAQFYSSDIPCSMWGVQNVHSSKFNNICYGLVMAGFTWSSARSYCESHNSSLVRFESESEFNAVKKWLYADLRMNRTMSVWTSAYRRSALATTWFWSTVDGDLVMKDGKDNSLWAQNEATSGMYGYMTAEGLASTNSSNSFGTSRRYFMVCEEKTDATSPRHLDNGCSPPPTIQNGYYSIPEAYYANATNVTFSCYNGFTMYDAATITCINGFWDKHIPSCVPITTSTETPTTAHHFCNPLPAVQYGNISPNLSVYAHGSVLHVECVTGFYSLQNNTMKCVNGYWTGTLPYCEKGGDEKLNAAQSKAISDKRYSKLLGGTIALVVLVVLAIVIVALVKLIQYRRNQRKSHLLLEMEDQDADAFGFS